MAFVIKQSNLLDRLHHPHSYFPLTWPASPSGKAAGPCHGGAGDDECYWEWEVSTPDEMGDRVSCPSHKLADSGHSRPRLLLLVGLESADSDITTYTES